MAFILHYSRNKKSESREDGIILNRSDEKIVDLRDTLEPIALLKVSQMCREMKTDGIIRIRIEDTDSHRSLLRLLQSLDVRVLADEKCSDPETGRQIIIQKHNKEEFK
jgi:TusA-related sulfurtransferase